MTASPIDTYATEVRQFRQILLWPLQLMPASPPEPGQQPWEALTRLATPWREVPDAFSGDPSTFPERHYAEFVTFLPYVQRFLYGEAPHRKTGYGESPITVFSRDDIARARVTLDPGSPPVELEVTRAQLYFFVDIDVVIPVLEVTAQDLDLTTAEDLLFRFGRAYPPRGRRTGREAAAPRWSNGSVALVKYWRGPITTTAPATWAPWHTRGFPLSPRTGCGFSCRCCPSTRR